MIRNLKALGLALGAVFAMSAIAASAAQATAGEFSWGATTSTLTAVEDPSAPNQIFTTTAGGFTCDNVHGDAAIADATSTSITGTKVGYWDAAISTQAEHKCTGPFGTKPIVNTTECHFRFHPGETVGEKGAGETTGTVDLVDTKGSETDCVALEAPGCILHIPPQNGINRIRYKTVKTGVKEEVTVTVTSNNITYHHTGFLCGNGSKADGTYEGKITITGTNVEGNQTDVTVT